MLQFAAPWALGGLVASMLCHMACSQPFGCAGGTDTRGLGLNVISGASLNQDFCDKVAATHTVSSVMDTCSAFCGAANIPLLVGIPTTGFNQQDIDQLCLGDGNASFIRYSPQLMANCLQWSTALDLVQVRAADFVAALDNMTYAQLQFRQGMLERVAALVQQVGSPDFQRQMQGADDNQLLPVFLQTLKANLQDFMNSGTLKQMLQSAADVVRRTGLALGAALKTSLPQLQNLVSQCGSTLLAIGNQNEYLLDICNQRTKNCLDKAGAYHVGCCCGAVPLSGSFGLGRAGRSLAESLEARGLQAQAPAGPVDVCAEAQQRAAGSLSQRAAALQATPTGQQLLRDRQQALVSKYPEYYQRCASGGRQLSNPMDGRPDAPAMAERDGPPAERHLKQGLTNCQPQRSQLLPEYKAAFWASTEAAYCDQLPPPPGKAVMDTAGLGDVCSQFCGPEAVPLLLGAIAFGFNQTDMDQVCLGGGLLEPNPTAVTRCHAQAQAVFQVTVKTAVFVAKLQVLAAEKLRFEATVRKAVETMKAAIVAEAETVLRNAPVGQKVSALAGLLSQMTQSLASLSAGSANLAMTTAMQAVDQAGQDLATTLATSMQAMDEFLTNCNRFYTGSGSQQEYLLDVCSQTSQECMDKPLGRHVGCCCGYNPFMALGKPTIPAATITGLRGPRLGDSSGRARTAGRRLQDTAATIYDVCGDSWAQSRAGVAAAEAGIKALQQQAVLDKAARDMAAKYPLYATCKTVGGLPDEKVSRSAPANVPQAAWLLPLSGLLLAARR